jgi:hypothetical protein
MFQHVLLGLQAGSSRQPKAAASQFDTLYVLWDRVP